MLPFDKLRVNIAACGGDFGINPVGFSLNCGKLRKNLKNLVEQGTDFGRNILIHAADFCSARNVDSAFIGLLFAEKNAEKRGFAAAVDADKADMIPGFDFKGYVFKKNSGNKRFF